MSGEQQPQSLTALMTSSPASQEEVKATPPQQEQAEPAASEAAPSDEVKAKEEPAKEAPKAEKSTEELLAEFEKAQQRLKDTQKWGNEAHQKYLEAQKRLHELGEISDEDYEAVRKTAPKSQDEMQKHVETFQQRYAIVKEYLTAEGKDPDELVEAFGAVFGKDQSVLQEFAQTPDDKKVRFVLDRGQEALELHRAWKTHGSLPAALAAIKQQALKEAAELAASTGKGKKADPDDEPVKAKPRITEGGNKADTDTFVPKTISQLMSR